MRHLYIAGVDRWADYQKDSMQINPVLTYQIDSCRFQIKGSQPNDGDEVIIEDDSLGRLFAGVIKHVDLAHTLPDKSVNVWDIDCDDYTDKTDQKLVVETYENVTADFIFRDIATKYCPGFTVNGVQSGAPIVVKIVFDYIYPSEAFKQLCDYVGWHWQPDYFKDLKFFNPDSLTTPAPMSLRPGGNFRNVKHTIDQTGLRNRVYVRGGTMLSDPFPYSIVADGVARIWNLPHSPHNLTVQIGNGPTINAGTENVDDESTTDYLMNFENKYVKQSSQTGVATIAQGTTIHFTYQYDIDVITMVEDIASQQSIAAVQGGDGVYEYVITDDSLTTIDAAEAAGNADLRQNANPNVTGSFDTEVTGWSPGQLVTIDLPDRGINGTYLVQKLTIKPIANGMWTTNVQYGGRLLGIADFLKALVSAQQKKKLNDTALLHKFAYGQDQVNMSDQILTTVASPLAVCGGADAICGFVECNQPTSFFDGSAYFDGSKTLNGR